MDQTQRRCTFNPSFSTSNFPMKPLWRRGLFFQMELADLFDPGKIHVDQGTFWR
jgi:hypothetical protein